METRLERPHSEPNPAAKRRTILLMCLIFASAILVFLPGDASASWDQHSAMKIIDGLAADIVWMIRKNPYLVIGGLVAFYLVGKLMPKRML